MTIWRLKRGLERKFRLGHPWVFSNELAHSPKGLSPGGLVELRDDSGQFLATGYGHPGSLISFRVLSREDGSIDEDFFLRKLRSAAEVRRACGVGSASHRLCFAEADGLPGLIVDRFFLAGSQQAFVFQCSTAGMNALIPFIEGALRAFAVEDEARSGVALSRTWIIAANDSSSRRLEGLEIEPKRALLKPVGAEDAVVAPATLQLERAYGDGPPVELKADLLGGQKTGFFLDQRANVARAAHLMAGRFGPLASSPGRADRPLRILDLCCYVGQWGSQLSAAARTLGLEVETTLVDASASALRLAAENVEAQGARAIVERRDALESLRELPARAYDVVICDPPAFAKKKKDLPAGQAAYAKLNREAMRRLAPGGVFATCSCSGLLGDDEFREAIARGAAANPDLSLRFTVRGSHAPDHPQLAEFPQGSYLKCWIGLA